MNKTTIIILSVAIVVVAAMGITLAVVLGNDEPVVPTPDTYNVEVEYDEAIGAITGSGAFEKDRVVELTYSALPDADKVFYAWKVNGVIVSFDNPYSFKVGGADITYEVAYAEALPKVDVDAVIEANLNAMGEGGIGSLSISKMFKGITLGQLLMRDKTLPYEVTSRVEFQNVYNTDMELLLSNDKTAADTVRYAPLGVYADMFFADARYKTVILERVIDDLYDVSLATFIDSDNPEDAIMSIASVASLKFCDVFDSYVQNKATIDYLPIYEALGDVYVINALTGSDAEAYESLKAFTIAEMIDFFVVDLKGESLPTSVAFRAFYDAMGDRKLEEFMGINDKSIAEIIDLIGDFKDTTVADIIESRINLPDSIKNADWYIEFANRTMEDILNSIAQSFN